MINVMLLVFFFGKKAICQFSFTQSLIRLLMERPNSRISPFGRPNNRNLSRVMAPLIAVFPTFSFRGRHIHKHGNNYEYKESLPWRSLVEQGMLSAAFVRG